MRSVLAAALVAVIATAGCGSATPAQSQSGTLVVAAAFFPIEQIVEQIAQQVGGDLVELVRLVPAGQEAHEYEPTPKQVAALERADIVFYLGGGFQPSVERAIGSLPDDVTRVDLRSSLSRTITDDPHAWLDPANMRAMTATAAATMAAVRPDLAQQFDANATAYERTLAELDGQFSTALTGCATNTLVSSHQAFAYLATAYGLTQLSISGVSPLDEPSPKALAAVVEAAEAAGVTTVFYEGNLPDDLARTVADEIGATTAALHTLESLSTDQLNAGETYIGAMTANLATLRAGLGCP